MVTQQKEAIFLKSDFGFKEQRSLKILLALDWIL